MEQRIHSHGSSLQIFSLHFNQTRSSAQNTSKFPSIRFFQLPKDCAKHCGHHKPSTTSLLWREDIMVAALGIALAKPMAHFAAFGEDAAPLQSIEEVDLLIIHLGSHVVELPLPLVLVRLTVGGSSPFPWGDCSPKKATETVFQAPHTLLFLSLVTHYPTTCLVP